MTDRPLPTSHARRRLKDHGIPPWVVNFILQAGHWAPAPAHPTAGRDAAGNADCRRYMLPPGSDEIAALKPYKGVVVVVDAINGCIVTNYHSGRRKEKPGNRATGCQAPIGHPSPGKPKLSIFPPHSGPAPTRRALPAPLGDGPPAATNGGPGVDVAKTAATEGGPGYPRLAKDGELAGPSPQHTTRDEQFPELGPIERRVYLFRWFGLGLCGLSAYTMLWVFAKAFAFLARLFR